MEPIQRTIHILKTASRLIAHYGFDKTTMEDISREAGVSKGSLYLVWSSKDELFDALLNYEMKQLLDDLEARVAAQRDPQGGTIANLYRHTLLALRSNPLMSALYARDSRVLGDFIRRQDMNRYTSRIMLGTESVRQMQSAGLLRSDVRPEVIVYLFSTIALGFMSISSVIPASDAPPLEEVGEALAVLVHSGLESPGGAAEVGTQVVMQMIEYMRKQYDASS